MDNNMNPFNGGNGNGSGNGSQGPKRFRRIGTEQSEADEPDPVGDWQRL